MLIYDSEKIAHELKELLKSIHDKKKAYKEFSFYSPLLEKSNDLISLMNLAGNDYFFYDLSKIYVHYKCKEPAILDNNPENPLHFLYFARLLALNSIALKSAPYKIK